jgi:hypothetical protein
MAPNSKGIKQILARDPRRESSMIVLSKVVHQHIEASLQVPRKFRIQFCLFAHLEEMVVVKCSVWVQRREPKHTFS